MRAHALPARLVLALILSTGLAGSPVASLRAAEAVVEVVEVDLHADLSGISLRQEEILRILLRAANVAGELYTLQRAAAAQGHFTDMPYHVAWPGHTALLARLLAQAADLSNDDPFRHYLTARARALITGDYARANAAWLAMRDSDLDVLIGPLGDSPDDPAPGVNGRGWFGAYVLLRDWAWGAQLARFSVFLPEAQQALPVSAGFKAEVPDVGLKLAVYDLIYHAGYGSVRVSSALPEQASDSRVRLNRGPRSLQLRNVMRARFDALVLPVADAMLVPEDRRQVVFEAFFLNTMLQEMARSLGMRETVTGRGPVWLVLGEHAATIEEAKAAVLSLWLAQWLHARGELPGTSLEQHYASFLANLFRNAHFDPDGSIGLAKVLLFNHFRDWGGIHRDADTGLYRVAPAEMPAAIEALAAQLLTLQGSGDVEGAAQLVETLAVPRAQFALDMQRLAEAGIPAALLFRLDDNLPGL
jgi:hypothetical protein